MMLLVSPLCAQKAQVYDKILDQLDAVVEKEKAACRESARLAQLKQWRDATFKLDQAKCPHIYRHVHWRVLTDEDIPPQEVGEAIKTLMQKKEWPYKWKVRNQIVQTLKAKTTFTELETQFLEEHATENYDAARVLCKGVHKKCHHMVNHWKRGRGSNKDVNDLPSALRKALKVSDVATRAESLFWARNYKEAAGLFTYMKKTRRKGLLEAIKMMNAKSPHTLMPGKESTHYEESEALRFAYAKRAADVNSSHRMHWILRGIGASERQQESWSKLVYQTCLDLLEHKRPQLAVSLVDKVKPQFDGTSDDLRVLSSIIAYKELKDPRRALEILKPADGKLKTAVSITRTAFWQGIYEEALGNKEEAKVRYQKAWSYPDTYYGKLAGRKLKKPHGPLVLKAHVEKGVVPLTDKLQELLLTALLADELDDKDGAQAYIYIATHHLKLSRPQRGLVLAVCESSIPQALVQTSMDMGLPRLRVTETAIEGEGVHKAFPSDYHDRVQHWAKHYDLKHLDAALCMALIRKESLFNPYVTSASGAEGLMQLMPRTAAELMRSEPDLMGKTQDLFDEELNVRLGVKYLKELEELFDGNPILVTAAYNAGLGRIQQWKKRWGEIGKAPEEEAYWVERVPFPETKFYIKVVNGWSELYRRILKRPKKQAKPRVSQVRETKLQKNVFF